MMKTYDFFKEWLDQEPFISILGKYDQILGPRALFSSIEFTEEIFTKNLLRDALNTKNQYVILDFNQFYAQGSKIEIEDKFARGGKQLYAIILIRDKEKPLIPISYLKRIEKMFYDIGNDKILRDDESAFNRFFNEVNDIYMKKNELLPMENYNLQVRSGLNTIQGFSELIKEETNQTGRIDEKDMAAYVDMMLDACREIQEAMDQSKTYLS